MTKMKICEYGPWSRRLARSVKSLSWK